MSKRHFDEYFNKVASQYHELLEGLKEFEQLARSVEEFLISID